ncbi:MAG: hypothetical protein M0Z83_06055 [Betaproteobacteria bacterium]|nr:hypothetical protein [Betaproteobacteria bacterium]
MSGLLPNLLPIDAPEDVAGETLIVATRFEHFEEPSARAEKMLGYDSQGRCCYSHHEYALTRYLLDDNDIFYEEVSFYEMQTAWLLESGQWLSRVFSWFGMGHCGNSSGSARFELMQNRPR